MKPRSESEITVEIMVNTVISLSLSHNSIQYVLYWHDNCFNVLPKHRIYIESRTDIYFKNNNTGASQ